MDAPPHDIGSGCRPTLGFHLGIALLMAAIFTLAGLFSCCYHWDRIRTSLFRTAAHHTDDEEIPKHHLQEGRKDESLPVIMPGDHVPKFIALTCPLQPPRLMHDNFVADVERRVAPPPKPAAVYAPFYTFVGPY